MSCFWNRDCSGLMLEWATAGNQMVRRCLHDSSVGSGCHSLQQPTRSRVRASDGACLASWILMCMKHPRPWCSGCGRLQARNGDTHDRAAILPESGKLFGGSGIEQNVLRHIDVPGPHYLDSLESSLTKPV